MSLGPFGNNFDSLIKDLSRSKAVIRPLGP